jgi:O-antigen polymerase
MSVSSKYGINSKNNERIDYIAIAVLGLWLVFFMHLPLYNVGGSGFLLPQNNVAWMIVTIFCCLILIVKSNSINSLKRSQFMFGFFWGCLLLIVPYIWQFCVIQNSKEVPRLLGICGGVVFYYCLSYISFSRKICSYILISVIISAFIESIMFLQGVFFPYSLNSLSHRFYEIYGHSGLGVFQQVNVTASWISTGLALALRYIYCKDYIYLSNKSHIKNAILSFVSIFVSIFVSTLILTKSRIGWLTGFVSLIIIFSCFSYDKTRHERTSNMDFLALFIPPVFGCILGVLLLDSTPIDALSHHSSNYQRILTIKTTWDMIMQHPLMGWGIGSFRSAFLNYMAFEIPRNNSIELMGHPHNEILYTWFEGGVVALIGFIFIILAQFKVLFTNFCTMRLAQWAGIIPIMLHTQVEFPLYYSAAHYIVLLILIGMLDFSLGDPVIHKKADGHLIFFRWSVLVMSALIIVWLFNVIKTENLLSHFENDDLPHLEDILKINPPYLVEFRFSRDTNLLLLNEYSVNSDTQLLNSYLLKNEYIMQEHPEPDDYDNQIRVLCHLGKNNMSNKYRSLAQKLFPWDNRFNIAC